MYMQDATTPERNAGIRAWLMVPRESIADAQVMPLPNDVLRTLAIAVQYEPDTTPEIGIPLMSSNDVESVREIIA